MRRTIIALLLVVVSLPALAHKGNPWHGPKPLEKQALGVGFGTAGLASARLRPRAPGVPTTFTFTYRTDVPLLVSDATRLVAGVMDDAPLASGAVTNAGIRKMRITDTTSDYKVVTFDFTIAREGVYHFFFGPWDGTTLYLGDDPPVEVTSADGRVQWISKVAGDVAIGANPDLDIDGQPGMAIWIQQIFGPAIPQYKRFKIDYPQHVLDEKVQPRRMTTVHDALKAIGLKELK